MPGQEVSQKQTYALPTYDQYSQKNTTNSVYGYGYANNTPQTTAKTSQNGKTQIDKIKNVCAQKNLKLTDDEINLLISAARSGCLNESEAVKAVIDAINLLINSKTAITVDNIKDELFKVILKNALKLEQNYNPQITPLNERINVIAKELQLNPKNPEDRKKAIQEIFKSSLKLVDDEQKSWFAQKVRDVKSIAKNAKTALSNGEYSKIFSSAEDINDKMVRQTLCNMAMGAATPDECAEIEAALREYAADNKTWQKYLKDIKNCGATFQTSLLVKGGEKVADEIDVNLTCPEEVAPTIEKKAMSMRSEEGAKKANNRTNTDAAHLYSIIEKLKNNETITDEDYKFLSQRYNIPKENVTIKSVQGAVNGLLTKIQGAQIYGAGCNKKLSIETREQIIYNNTQYENGNQVTNYAESLIENEPENLVVDRHEFINEIETIHQQALENHNQLSQPPTQNNCAEQEYSNGSLNQSYTTEATSGLSYNNQSHAQQLQQGSLGFEQHQSEQPKQTIRPIDLYPNQEEQNQITIVKPKSTASLGSQLKNNIGNVAEIVDKHIQSNGAYSFVREVLNCRGAMRIKYVRDKVIQIFNSMTTSLRINMFNNVLNNENAGMLLSELDNNELNSVKAQNSYINSQIESAKKHREKMQGAYVS